MEIIVSSTNLGALYKASENVLKKYGDKTQVPENIKGQSVLSILKTIFGKDTFYISDLNKMLKTYNVEMSNEHLEWMQTLSCVSFNDMHPDTKEYLFAICVEYFKPVISMSYVANN